MAARTSVLEFAVLGLLHDSSMHGYELRKRLTSVLGPFRAISYGSLYPCLKDLVAAGLIAAEEPTGPQGSARRNRISYALTADGKDRFAELADEAGPANWEDEPFGVRFAFFSRTHEDVRLRILQGRRSRLEERVSGLRDAMTRTRSRLDDYTLELQRHGLERAEREVRWLGELIATEEQRRSAPPNHPTAPSTPPAPADVVAGS